MSIRLWLKLWLDILKQNKSLQRELELTEISISHWTSFMETWPQTDSYFFAPISPLLPFPLFFPPLSSSCQCPFLTRRVLTLANKFGGRLSLRATSGTIEPALCELIHAAGCQEREVEVKHFKTKQPGIHMVGREREWEARMGGWREGETPKWARSVTWFGSKRPAQIRH